MTKALGEAATEAYQKAGAESSKEWKGHPSDSVDTDYEVKE